MSEPLAKAYEPRDVERRWYPFWEERGFFRADPSSNKPSFCVVLPPPNVTGSLHIGHAFTNTLQDVIARWKRMCGFDVLWLPGLDHAGIATQMVVERQLAKEGKRKEDLGREAFEKRVWAWKEESGGIILRQLRLMGFSLDWSRERFTMDAGLSRAVREVFVSLHEQGLVYRGTYIVNWCPRCVTALSDLEVETEAEPGSLWHIRYPGADGGDGIVVATTRPETMLGDVAVAVHPDDERYRHFFEGGSQGVRLPIMDRVIPVVADTFVDPSFGTGAVKITPPHDPADFEASKRLGLRQDIVVIDDHGLMTGQAGAYAGQDRFEARKGIVAQLEREGLLVKTVPHQVPLGRCQRCKTVVEPRLSAQWFVRTTPLAEPGIAAVEDGRIRFVPENWSKTYFEWMRNIRDWCVSRQLWWGHQIPAWYCDPCGEVIVAREEPEACPKCGGRLRQEVDVLDTWFSSGLFPFSTLGWPDRTPDLARYYPNDVMMTGFDIIFFWVARMVMLGMRFAEDVPFRTVFINGLVRDEHGEKMSKVKGNSVDPLDVIEKHGADALRFTLAALAAPGTDPSFGEGRLLGYKAFVNKLWNAARFVLMNLEGEIAPSYDAAALPLPSRWIRERLDQAAVEVNDALAAFRFDQAANALYHFLWDELCDWYVEISKAYLSDPASAPVARKVLVEVLEAALRLLHPLMPFVTEELWQRLPHEGESVMLAPFPQGGTTSGEAQAAMAELMALVSAIRTVRSEYGVDPKRRIDVTVVAPGDASALVEQQAAWVRGLARLETLAIVGAAPPAAAGTIRQPVGRFEVHVPLAGLFDVEAERARLARELDKVQAEHDGLAKRLDNPQFVERAKPEVVAESRQKRDEMVARMEKIRAMLGSLGEA
jgi:valyl-tRNA synthetase